MFGSFDTLREITSTIAKNKLRTFLTGMAVAWGIFMLIILLAAGKGLENGIRSNFSSRAQNAVTLWPGTTSMPYKGMPVNRNLRFDMKDYNLVKSLPETEYISPAISNSVTLTYKEDYGSWQLTGVMPDFSKIEFLKIMQGRFINNTDEKYSRKVIVISQEIKDILFKEVDPIGKFVNADGVMFKVIGVYTTDRAWGTPPAYIPFSTAQILYQNGWFDSMQFTIVGVNGEAANDAFIEGLRGKMGQLHTFNPDDLSALYIRNTAKDADQANSIFAAITIFIWIIGISSLTAGIVGVGNIMLVTVKERTREIGIRKALGAKPAGILKLILSESVIITTIAGYVGIMLGIGVVALINMGMESAGGDSRVFRDPSVDILVIIEATLVLIIAGTFAGLIPAMKATRISPIEAMRAE